MPAVPSSEGLPTGISSRRDRAEGRGLRLRGGKSETLPQCFLCAAGRRPALLQRKASLRECVISWRRRWRGAGSIMPK